MSGFKNIRTVVALGAISAAAAVSAPASAALKLDPTLCVSVEIADGGCKFLSGNLGNQTHANAAEALYNANRNPDIGPLNYLGSNTTGNEFGSMSYDDASTKLAGTWATPGF